MSPEIFTELIITIDEPPEDPEGEYTENLIPLAFHGMWGPPEDDKEIYHNICHPCHTYPIARKMWLHTIELCKTKLISR